MKRFNRKIFKATNWILAGILTLLGFSGCKVEYDLVEYGCPHADFIVSGKVTDLKGNGLSGIRVTVPSVDQHQRATSGFIPGYPVITQILNDTLYTNANGQFNYAYGCVPVNDSINIKMKFEDVSEHIRFETDSTKVTFFSSDLKGGDDRWYSGKATKEIIFYLKEKD